MLTEKIDSNVIHFYQKAVDKTALIRFTTDFILKIFELFYKKQYSTNPGLESKRIINSIQATLFAKINEYVKDINLSADNIIDIKFEKDNAIPIVSLHHETKKSDTLFNVFFKKINWEEINEFRVFMIKYLKYYLTKYHFSYLPDEHKITKVVTDLSYVVQELLQNANAYSYGSYDYELILKHSGNRFNVIVSNFSDKENAKTLINIVDEIHNTKDLQELIIKYMRSEEKHLGIITSVFNYNVSEYKVNYIDNKIIQAQFMLEY
ncbi:MAG: hypothetical protein A2086_06660 [Spirochaetes bacterium GWD1_27_9]|nr:MAG: hypothetical protein A2Z98_00515 [Spirochaetes bacterium GWB1_27_13]OHD20050.1 MAG: hypothetical protein A2Y34_08070 [Spirochaetes bacterium GWC1_27_15]OHD41320.1 MAG: hypothetical protein A2086_06660 [Spirochaetes bacterium GWD1_27_9]